MKACIRKKEMPKVSNKESKWDPSILSDLFCFYHKGFQEEKYPALQLEPDLFQASVYAL